MNIHSSGVLTVVDTFVRGLDSRKVPISLGHRPVKGHALSLVVLGVFTLFLFSGIGIDICNRHATHRFCYVHELRPFQVFDMRAKSPCIIDTLDAYIYLNKNR